MDSVDVMGCIVPHLGPYDVNRLLRCSCSVRYAVSPHEEAFWSRAGSVRTYRDAALIDCKLHLHWIGSMRSESFRADPVHCARDILRWLWDLKLSRDDEKCALFVSCSLFPDLITVPVPCFLFATNASDWAPETRPICALQNKSRSDYCTCALTQRYEVLTHI